MRRAILALILAFLSFLALTCPGNADTPPQAPLQVGPSFATGRIEKDGGIILDVRDHLSPRQWDIISSGFTTISQVSVYLVPSTPDGLPTELTTAQCSVKFDAWEEAFEIVMLGDDPKSTTVRNSEQFSAACLRLRIPKTLLAGKEDQIFRSRMFIRISARQASPEETEKIKGWLVKQQSGVMQSLFSHMLGEFTLSEMITMPLVIKPLTPGNAAPSGATPSGARQPGAPPGKG
jgi:hypothetical protein